MLGCASRGEDADRSAAANMIRATWAAQVELTCLRQGFHLTPLRRRVLDIFGESAAPLGAYAIIEELSRRERQTGRPADGLSDARLLHRARLRAQDREPQRLCAVRASRPRPPGHAPHLRGMRAERGDRGRRGHARDRGLGGRRRFRPAAGCDGSARAVPPMRRRAPACFSGVAHPLGAAGSQIIADIFLGVLRRSRSSSSSNAGRDDRRISSFRTTRSQASNLQPSARCAARLHGHRRATANGPSLEGEAVRLLSTACSVADVHELAAEVDAKSAVDRLVPIAAAVAVAVAVAAVAVAAIAVAAVAVGRRQRAADNKPGRKAA